ncbi:MAG TPA: hypothetical protein PK950_03335 [Candidatus Paceibacterota bacterium]|nr:hypothetical protein [Candidatus Paceibacterota bacterium]
MRKRALRNIAKIIAAIIIAPYALAGLMAFANYAGNNPVKATIYFAFVTTMTVDLIYRFYEFKTKKIKTQKVPA